MAVRRSDPLEINQVWSDPLQDYKALRVVLDNQGSGGGAGSKAIEVVVDDVVVFAIDQSGNFSGTGIGPVNVTAATLTATAALHAGRTVTLNRAAGQTVTLPAASGSGAKYEFFIGTTVTSNSTIIKVANSSDIMAGVAMQAADGGSTINGWETGASDDTITFDGSTKGGIKGDRVVLVDVAANVWMVNIFGSATGTEATPFSATV